MAIDPTIYWHWLGTYFTISPHHPSLLVTFQLTNSMDSQQSMNLFPMILMWVRCNIERWSHTPWSRWYNYLALLKYHTLLLSSKYWICCFILLYHQLHDSFRHMSHVLLLLDLFPEFDCALWLPTPMSSVKLWQLPTIYDYILRLLSSFFSSRLMSFTISSSFLCKTGNFTVQIKDLSRQDLLFRSSILIILLPQ